MFRIISLITGLVFCLSYNTQGQFTEVNSTVLKQNPDDLVNYQAMSTYGLNTFDLRDFTPDGSPYYGDKWYDGTLVLFDDKEIKCPMLFDVEDQEFFIQLNDEIFLLPNGVVKRFQLGPDEDGSQTSTTYYSMSTSNSVIYYELLGKQGDISLIKLFDVKIIAPNYNPAIDVGTHKKTYVKKETLALMDKSTFIELRKPRNKTFKKFNNTALQQALKKGNVSFDDEESILAILNNNFKNL